MSVGCLEPQFFKVFIEHFIRVINDDGKQAGWIPSPETQANEAEWPRLRKYLNEGFLTRTRDQWTKVYHGMLS